jgi:MFS family permease
MDKARTFNKNILAALFFACALLIGFESGGYQACLMSIGREFALSDSLMGTLVSVQLVAVMLAPLVFGPLADKIGKKKILTTFLLVGAIACAIVMLSPSAGFFAVGIFLEGFSVSIVFYIAVAGLTDAYPVTAKRKMGYITCAYSVGAFLAPVICSVFLQRGFSWKILFAIVFVMSLFLALLLYTSSFAPREEKKEDMSAECMPDAHGTSKWMLPGILLLCFMMFIYVGVESGFTYFLNSFVQSEIKGSYSYLALSVFWLAMIPSRILCGIFGKFRNTNILLATVGVSVFAFCMSMVYNPLLAIVLSFVLGFFCGAVYPSVLNFLVDFAGDRTATATGMISIANGLGGAVIAMAFGTVADTWGIRTGFVLLGVLMLLDILAAAILIRKTGK